MAATNKEIELVVELRSVRKQFYASQRGSDEFKELYGQLQRITEELELERHSKHRARKAVEFINYRPTIDVKVYKAFKYIGIITALAAGGYMYLSGDILFETKPSIILLGITTLLFLFYYLGYICQVRK